MLKQLPLLLLLFACISCKQKLYVDQIEKTKLGNYFTLEITSKERNGKLQESYHTGINKAAGDAVSAFIKAHAIRFDYLITKEFTCIIEAQEKPDSVLTRDSYNKALQSDSFYNRFVLLTCGNRNTKDKTVSFTNAEMMRTASRFFMCDEINKADTTIAGYHVCAGINGISEIKTTRDLTALEAFCIEAIFKTTDKDPKLYRIFDGYISEYSAENKKHFTGFKEYLSAVKHDCFNAMEKDETLQAALLSYYEKNKENINFRIE